MNYSLRLVAVDRKIGGPFYWRRVYWPTVRSVNACNACKKLATQGIVQPGAITARDWPA